MVLSSIKPFQSNEHCSSYPAKINTDQDPAETKFQKMECTFALTYQLPSDDNDMDTDDCTCLGIARESWLGWNREGTNYHITNRRP
jgi:hypothetical protein